MIRFTDCVTVLPFQRSQQWEILLKFWPYKKFCLVCLFKSRRITAGQRIQSAILKFLSQWAFINPFCQKRILSLDKQKHAKYKTKTFSCQSGLSKTIKIMGWRWENIEHWRVHYWAMESLERKKFPVLPKWKICISTE